MPAGVYGGSVNTRSTPSRRLGGSSARDPLEGGGVEHISEAVRALTFDCEQVGDDILVTARLREW